MKICIRATGDLGAHNLAEAERCWGGPAGNLLGETVACRRKDKDGESYYFEAPAAVGEALSSSSGSIAIAAGLQAVVVAGLQPGELPVGAKLEGERADRVLGAIGTPGLRASVLPMIPPKWAQAIVAAAKEV